VQVGLLCVSRAIYVASLLQVCTDGLLCVSGAFMS